MCGICGQYSFDRDVRVQESDLERMAATLEHRGPDDKGTYTDGQVGLGFRRLSIIDLTGGHQPMSDAEGTLWVVFNGEIYNFPELRKELQGFGHSFRTNSDTEVIVHGYKQWGADVVNRLNGMFGFAIWDTQKKKLIVARDAMGIKPVYYKIGNESLYFASEIRAITAAMEESVDVDPAALNLFLRYRYTPAPLTIYRGIRKLAPGTMLTVEHGECSVERWYRYKPTPLSPTPSVGAVQEELLDIYKRAMKRHLLSDVPVGLLLSGGIDSGLLLGLMNLYGENWRTYTVGYGESFSGDEIELATETARLLKADHTNVRLERETFESALSHIIESLEEPVATSSIVPMYFVCQRAREDVKVAMIGQGPDELFGGYRRHVGVRYGGLWRGLPGFVQSAITGTVNRLPRGEMFKRGVYALGEKDRMKRYQSVFSLMPGESIDGLFREDVGIANAGDHVLECWKDLKGLMGETDELGGFQLVELMSSLPDELLMFADKLSMAHSLEVRVPFLDKEVVEYVTRLPANFKVRRGNKTKWIHRRVCSEFLPESILKRKKQGFGVNVVDSWFYGRMSGRLEGLLLDSESLMFQYLRPDAVKRLFDEHKAKQADNHKVLFSLVVFEEWLRLQSVKVT